MIQGSQPDLVIWDGPIWAGILDPVVWLHPTQVLTLACKGSDGCAALAAGLPRKGVLAALLAKHKSSVDQWNRIILAGFSAGHGLNEIILSDPESNQRVGALCSCDSYYTGKVPGIKAGHYAFAKRASEGNALMWTSTSSFPGPGYVSSEDAIKPLLDAFMPTETELPGDVADKIKLPIYCVSKGTWFHAHFGDHYKHAEHATVIAPAVLDGWISPAIRNLPTASVLKTIGMALGVAALFAGAFFGARAIWRM